MGTLPTTDGQTVSIETVMKSVPQAKLEEAIVSAAATSRVVSDPLPGPMLDAVANQELEIKTSRGVVVLRPVVVYDFTLFKKLNSPHYRTMLEQANSEFKTDELNVEDEELYEMIYQFTHTCKEVRTELKKGREQFREVATAAIADYFNMDDLQVLLEGVATQITKGFATMTAHGVPDKEGEAPDELDKKK